MTDETRARFLASIARQIPPEQVIEVHLFSAIKQGGMESGVAVVAVERVAEPVEEGDVQEPTTGLATEPAADPVMELAEIADEPVPATPRLPSRYIVYTARYRHTLKGLDRGKWESSVVEEADAPLLTVDAVVRGVQRRSGDADETVRLSGDEFRAALPQPVAAA